MMDAKVMCIGLFFLIETGKVLNKKVVYCSNMLMYKRDKNMIQATIKNYNYILAWSNPTFQKISCDFVPDNDNYDLCLYVSFPDQADDMLLLNKVHDEDTVFQGTLFSEGTRVCIIMEDASNPDDIEVKTFLFILVVDSNCIKLHKGNLFKLFAFLYSSRL